MACAAGMMKGVALVPGDRLRELMQEAKGKLAASGALLPLLLVEGRERLLVGIGTMPPTAEQRRLLFFALGRRLAESRPRRAIAVMDAYLKVDSAGADLPGGSLADDPAARDCIVVASLDRQGRSRVLVCPYERRPRLEGLEVEFATVQALPSASEVFLLKAFFEGVGSA